MISERLSVIVDAKTAGAVGEFRKLGKEIDGTTPSIQRLEKGLAKVGLAGKVSGSTVAAAAGAVGVAAIAGFGRAVQAASDLSEQVSATKVVFGSAAEDVLRFGKDAAGALGMSNTAALQAANGFGDLFQNFGVASETAGKLSTGIVRLAADVASFKNLRPEDVLLALKSGLSGEAEPLRKLGVFLNEATVKAKAMEMGMGGAHRELTDGEKVLARYAIILDQTQSSQGDLARTSQSYANQQREANARLEDSWASLGQKLKPLATAALQTFNDLLPNSDSQVVDFGMVKFEKDASTLLKLQQVLLGTGFAARSAADEFSYAALKEQVLGLATGELTRHMATTEEGMKKAAEASEKFATAMTAGRGVVAQAMNAERGLAEARASVGLAEERVATTRRELNKLLTAGAVNAREVERATRSLEAAQRGVADAELRAAEARKALDKVRLGTDPGDLTDGELSVEAAQLAVERAVLREVEARKALSKAQTGDERLHAEIDLRDAQLGVLQAGRSLEESRERLNELQQYGKEGSEALAEAERRVAEAEQGVNDAVRNRLDAQRGLNEANRGDLEFSEKVEAAKKRVRDAEDGVAKAKDGVAESILRVMAAQNQENALLSGGLDIAAALSGQLAGIVGMYPELMPLLDRLNGLLRSGPVGSGGPGAQIATAFAAPWYQGRQHGGPVMGGTPYVVGEAGPELFVPGASGQIIPNNRMGGGGVTLVVNAGIGIDAHAVGSQLVEFIEAHERRSGKAWRN